MSTTTSARLVRSVTAVLLGYALAITPISANAAETDAARTNLRQQLEADRGSATREIQPNLRQQLEADRGSVTRKVQPNLRQQMEADRGPMAEVQPYQQRRIEDHRSPEPVPPPRVVPNDTDPRERPRAGARPERPDVYIHLRVLGLG